jgi:hypothetical protein
LGEDHRANLVASGALGVEAPHRVAHHLEDLREDRRREELSVTVVQRGVFEQRAGDEARFLRAAPHTRIVEVVGAPHGIHAFAAATDRYLAELHSLLDRIDAR